MAKRAGSFCPGEVQCRLLQINCAELKEALGSKARALHRGAAKAQAPPAVMDRM